MIRPVSEFIQEPINSWARPDQAHLIRLYEKDRGHVVESRDQDGTLQLTRPVSRGPLAGWVMHLPYEKNPIPANKKSHGHWATAASAVRGVRETARILALHSIPPQPGQIRVRLDWEVIDRRDRDEDNLVLCMKALVDGLRLGMVVEKDTKAYVLREMPEINYAPRNLRTRPAAFMRLHIHRVTV